MDPELRFDPVCALKSTLRTFFYLSLKTEIKLLAFNYVVFSADTNYL